MIVLRGGGGRRCTTFFGILGSKEERGRIRRKILFKNNRYLHDKFLQKERDYCPFWTFWGGVVYMSNMYGCYFLRFCSFGFFFVFETLASMC